MKYFDSDTFRIQISLNFGWVLRSQTLWRLCGSNAHFPAKAGPKKSRLENKRDNYRLISLLASFSKIYEKLVYHRIVNFLESNRILDMDSALVGRVSTHY